MNRIILIGNGFDLAHQRKTSYNDFILDYLKKAYQKAYNDGKYTDEFLEISTIYKDQMSYGDIKTLDELIDHFYQRNFKILFHHERFEMPGWGMTYRNPFKTVVKSSLFKTLVVNCSDCKWVDIENEFYDALKKILTQNIHSGDKTAMLNDLNTSMAALQKKLEAYLSGLPEAKYDRRYDKIFFSDIKKTDLVSPSEDTTNRVRDTLFLNFNYTDTAAMYNTFNRNKVILNHIHGRLNDPDQPMIFGFGDELDKDYELIENDKTQGIFSYIKSFGYFLTPNYRDLIRFIETGEYQVQVMGHSCGLSDRTMLNMLFEHENCKSIKIYYYENGAYNNFTELTQEISRHFKDKQSMRRKIVDIKHSQPMPQLDPD